ncbi:MAG: hypothetical protein H0V70_16910 [Ktedonobacteraceae bacterium]|nr:hypothetical protein [Ktedonobacteraceae bacterium]
MSLNVCPAAIVAAPVEVVWDLLRPARLSEWADGQVDAPVPEGPAVVGQIFQITSKAFRRNWHSSFRIEKVNPERHQLDMHVDFPFGMQLQEHLSCMPIDASSCRVQYG